MPVLKQSDLPLLNGKPAPKEFVDALVAMIIVFWFISIFAGLSYYFLIL